MENLITGKKVLEVGSGAGSFLKEAAKKSPKILTGIEISSEAIKKSKTQVPSLKIHNTSFEDFSTNERFDTLFMFHVIEHFKDPLKALRKVNKILKSKGVLVMETPNWDSWEQEIFGRNWYGWQVPFHTFLFSQKSLRKIVEKSGFRVVSVEHSKVPNSWVGSLKKKYPEIRKLGFMMVFLYGAFYLPSVVAAARGKGGRIVIRAIKR